MTRECRLCGGVLEVVGEHDKGRSFRLYECPECGAEGGEAWGCGLPDEAWGVVSPQAIAVGGVR